MHNLSHDLLDPRLAASGGDGASPMTDAHSLAQHQRKLRAFRTDETGLSFASLALFAEPLFDLYDLDPAAAFDLFEHPDDADEATVAVLEAARVLWAYLSLPPKARAARHDALAAFLLGPDPEPGDEADLDRLLDAAETHWDALTPDDVALAEGVDAETLGFDALLAHPAFAHAAEDHTAEGAAEHPDEPTYGPNRLGEMEARALFAQPLLEDETDLDALDAAMERADEYWTLAHLRGPKREAHLDEIVEAFAADEAGAAALRAEAERMAERFGSLFPEQA